MNASQLRATPPATPSSSRAVVAESRRGLPRVPRGFVESRAVQRLSADMLPPVLVLQAPRGFGKSASISWLLRQDDGNNYEPVWINLPHAGVTGEEFWETVHRRLRDAVLEEPDWDALNRAMGRRRRRLVLVIDALDRIADVEVDDELAELAAMHDSIHVVATTRLVRPLQTLAAAIGGVVLRAGDLRLRPAEAVQMAALLGQVVGNEALEELTTSLRGWPALLRIILGEPMHVVGGAIVVDQQLVDRYVRLQLSDIHDTELLRALTALAVPLELPSELVMSLVGRPGVDALARLVGEVGAAADVDTSLSGLAAAALPAGPVRVALAAMLEESDPQRYRKVNRRSAEWFASHGQQSAALQHALAAQDWGMVTELLLGSWAITMADHPELARAALDRLPEHTVNAHARLSVARDYILNIATAERARAAFAAGLLLPDGAARARVGRRLSLRQVLNLHSTGLYDVSRHMVENRKIADAIDESGWSDEVVSQIPRLLLEWAVAYLLGAPGLEAAYAFCEAATWAEELKLPIVRADAVAGAALSHVVIGYPRAAQAWLDQLDALGSQPEAKFAPVAQAIARALIAKQTRQVAATDLGHLVIPSELADLEALAVSARTDALLRQGRSREAVRLLESFRVRPNPNGVISLVEHALVTSLVEAYLASDQVERARRLLLEVDPWLTVHVASWAMVDFQSGEYERVMAADVADELVPRQALQIALLRACAALRLQQRPAAIDAFQAAVSAASQTGNTRPFTLIPAADLVELSDGDPHVAELLGSAGRPAALLPEPHDGSGLSPRELQVLEVVSTGASFAAVASRLFVSPNTVKSQMRDIYRKLGVRGREHAVERARELGLLKR